MATKKTAPPKASAGETAVGSNKPVDSVKHAKAQRVHIPSREEAGQEADALQGRPTVKAVPLNPVTHRGQDPELYWLHKYGADDAQDALNVDIRSLYRHEHIAPEKIISRLYSLKGRTDAQNELFTNELFGNPLAMDELDKPLSYYKQADKWQNRLVQGDSLLVMTSLLEREGMAGLVQCIYMDPPYGIKYGSNWQMRLGDNQMPNSEPDTALSGEPEVIKAFRDTWELGIHSYLSYLRDRLLVARELLSQTGSVFVQISDENLHLVRCLMDEVFGSENFIAVIPFRKKTMPLGANFIEQMGDFLIWYGKQKLTRDGRVLTKFRKLYAEKDVRGDQDYKWLLLPNGSYRAMTKEEHETHYGIPAGARIYRLKSLEPSGPMSEGMFDFEYEGTSYSYPKNGYGTTKDGMQKLKLAGRLQPKGRLLNYRLFLDDYPVSRLTSPWTDTVGADAKAYVVQTNTEVVKRCLLMTTDPGDLVLDPTCGSGTTAFVAEQWGRRWVTSDTSRIALNIAKTRLMTATFPWFKLLDVAGQDVRHGFKYSEVSHLTLGSLVNDEPPASEKLFDRPEIDSKKLRVAGPFTVETLQSFEPLAPDRIVEANTSMDNVQRFIDRVFEHLKTAGIKNGAKNETAIFNRVDIINDEAGVLHAEGWYLSAGGEKKAYLHIGPQFGTVSRAAVNAAIKACRQRADADWLVLLGFGFESDVDNRNVTMKVGGFEVTKVRMHDDLMQDGLIKKDKKAASFVTIGEPDIGIIRQGDQAQVEIRGLDIYDPVKDEVKGRSVADISYWMVDDAYDGANFVPSQVFFCGGDADEFDKFKRGLQSLALASTKKAAERTLKVELDDEAFERLYGFTSHPITAEKGRKVAVRVISQFGEESTKVLTL